MPNMSDNHRLTMSLETARARDFYRYYYPFSHQLRNNIDSEHDLSSHRPSIVPVRDPALDALCEVGALRLKARRAIISFFDLEWQYVLAEATSEPDDELWLGPTVVKRGNSCCEYTAELESHTELASSGEVDVTVIPDLTKHETFCQKDFVLKSPFGRFYAGVPIRTPQGFNIGAYCILDDEPRAGLTPSQTKLLKEMGIAVMNHLDRIRATAEQQRAGKMVRGLGNFIGGRSGLEDWWCKANKEHDVNRCSVLSRPEKGARPSTLSKQYSSQTFRPYVEFTSENTNQEGGPGQTVPYPDAAHGSYKGILPDEVVSTFQRAVGIVRDALDVDGVLYLDASISSFGGLVSRQPSALNVADASREHTIEDYPQVFSGQRKTDSGRQTPEKYGFSQPEPDRVCDILGLSTLEPRDMSGFEVGQQFLSSLLQRYPRGRVWCFDENEELDNMESSSLSADVSALESFLDLGLCRTGTRSMERSHLRRLFPGVRSLAFTGLWDGHKARFLSGSIIWTCDPMRVFAPEHELSYLSAFGDTLMAEISRVNVKLADQAKADFISSISHELRSPLHGILGSVECLQETGLDASQQDLLSNVKICGETLLDTVHHLLDHAKINTLSKEGNASFQSTSFSKGIESLESNVDLTILTEQAVETVFAGHTFASANTRDWTLANSSHAQGLARHPVSVNLSFDNVPGCPWTFRTSAGAWRRIILNLVGNSLKYTEEGHVNVDLTATPIETSDERTVSRITLTVTDTGKGISEEFLRNQLFEPFSQEDFLVAGTGLGLSMCRQIVASLGGRIEVRSKINQGTSVRVIADLSSPLGSEVSAAGNETILPSIMERHNKTINFFGIDPQDQSFANHKATLERTCKDWLGMDFNQSLEPGVGDVYLTTQDCMADLAASRTNIQNGNVEPFVPLQGPLIVLCDSASTAQALQARQDYCGLSERLVEFVSQPYGPRKLAKALDRCLRSPSATIPVSMPFRPAAKLSCEDLRLHAANMSADAELVSQKKSLPPHPDQLLCPIQPHIIPATPPASEVPESANNPQFVFSTPEIQHAPQPSCSGTVESITPSLEKARTKVLLVDDNAVNLRILATYMKKKGYDYATAVNGLEALELFKASNLPQAVGGVELTLGVSSPQPIRPQPFSFVLMDINMPVMDGLESTRQIRAFEQDSGLLPARILALTGLVSAEAQQEAFGSGVDLFLTKPVRLKELAQIMSKSGE